MRELQQAIASLLSPKLSVLESTPVGGGCISDVNQVRIRDERGSESVYCVKSNDLSFLGNFRAEWDGLHRIDAINIIRVPRPIAVGQTSSRVWLILEWVNQSRPKADYFEAFGQRLAEFHRATLGNRIGLEIDNFLGSAPQVNSETRPWARFVAEQRIDFQMRWATEQGLANSKLRQDVGRILENLEHCLAGGEEGTSLLHGDLWSGNYLCDDQGEPVLIDPAVYYGNREAEFGMLRLFGACPDRFYESYQEAFPLAGGWQRRVNVYVLYHLLNHLNLFGRGYHNQCCQTAAEILRG